MKPLLTETEEAVILDPPGAATGLVIWLHGLGADGYDFVPFARELRLAERGLRVIFPHAPYRPITINAGYVMRAWYDVRDTDFARAPDETGIRASAARISHLIGEQAALGFPADRVVLGGFSQGGVIALEAGLRYPEPLAGVVGLSTYLALPDHLQAEAADANRTLSLFLGHGEQDPLIPLALAERSARRLEGLGYAVEFHRYWMAHSVCAAEVGDVDAWLRRLLGRG